MSLPEPIPFWEQRRTATRRGENPVTDWVRSREYLDAKQKERLARIMRPDVHVESTHVTDGMNTRQRRALGLCVVDLCGRATREPWCEMHIQGQREKTNRRRTRAHSSAKATSCDYGDENESESVK